MSILKLHRITKIYDPGTPGEVKALDDIDLEVKEGEVVLVMGPSGSGKTTLLTIGGGILKPTSGTVLIEEVNVTSFSERELPKIRSERVGFIFQSFNLLEALTALENVEIVLNISGVRGSQATKKAKELLESLGLGERLNFPPRKLSGGERQRISIARALANEPKLLLADEPTANLDSSRGHEVMELLRSIAKKRGKAILIASHDERLREFADRVLWLEDGKFKKLTRMAHDPTCGMRVEKLPKTPQVVFEGKTYYFCSEGCKKEFMVEHKVR